MFSEITNASLISIGQLCDDGCEAKFTKKSMYVSKNGEKIIEGVCNFTNGLWDISLDSLPKASIQKFNAIIRKDKSKSELALYLHAR